MRDQHEADDVLCGVCLEVLGQGGAPRLMCTGCVAVYCSKESQRRAGHEHHTRFPRGMFAQC